MLLFHQMGQDQPLPVPVQIVLGHDALQLDAAASRQGVQKQMHLRVVAQRLEMPHALHRLGNGLPVKDPALVQAQIHVEALLHQALENLGLDFSHKAQLDGAVSLIPGDVQLGVLLAKLTELRQKLQRIQSLRQQQPIAQHRLQHRICAHRLFSQALAGPGMLRAQGCADLARRHLVRRVIFRAGIQAQLMDLFLAAFPVLILKAKQRADLQLSPRDFQKRHPVSLRVPLDLIDPGGKSAPVPGARRPAVQRVQQLLHAIQLQTGAEEAGKQRAATDHLRQKRVGERFPRQHLVHGPLVAQSEPLRPVRIPAGGIHAVVVQPAAQLVHQLFPALSGQVPLRDKHKNRDPAAAQQTPEGLRMGLDAVCAADDKHRAVQDLQRAFRLSGKIRMPGSVQKRHLPVRKRESGLFGENGDASLPLQAVGVQEAVPMVHAPQLFQFSGMKQHGLGQGGLPRVHMGQDADHGFVRLIHAFDCISKAGKNQLIILYLWSKASPLVILMQNLVKLSKTLATIFVRCML